MASMQKVRGSQSAHQVTHTDDAVGITKMVSLNIQFHRSLVRTAKYQRCAIRFRPQNNTSSISEPKPATHTPPPHHQLNRHARLILPPHQSLPPLQDLTRRPCKTRHNIQRRIFGKEVSRSQQQRHGLGGHDGKVLRGGEMDDAKGVPEDNVGLGDVGGRVGGDPFGKAAGGGAGGLGHVAASGVELGVVVWEGGSG